MKKNLKKSMISAMLAATIMVQFTTPALASREVTENITNNGVKIEKVSDDNIKITENGKENRVTVEENDDIRLITIYDDQSGKKEFIKYDKKANTIYSSLTNEMIDLDQEKDLSPDNQMTASDRATTSYETKYISYASIKRIVGKTATTGSIIGAILFFVPGAQSIGGGMSAISTIVTGINSGIKVSSKHGVKLKIKVGKRYRWRLGKRHVYRTDRTIVSASLY